MVIDNKTSSIGVMVIAIGLVMNLIGRGYGESFAVFLLPFENEFGASRAELTRIYSIYMFVLGIGAPVSGWVFDRFGPRLIYSLGVIMLGGGFCLASYAPSVGALYFSVGFLAGCGSAAIGVVPASSLTRRWYRKRLGTAMGLVYAGLGCGVILIVPFAQVLINSYGWRFAYLVLGIGVFVLLLPIVFIPWRVISDGHPALSETKASRDASSNQGSIAFVVGDRNRLLAFVGLFNIYFFTAIAVYSTNVQVVAFFVERGIPSLTAATAFGVAGLLSVAGVVGAGWLADRFGRLKSVTLTYAFTISGVASLILFNQTGQSIFVVMYVIGLGLFQGARGPIVSTLASEIFGGPRYGAIYGTVTLGMGIGASAGAATSGWLRDITGDYNAVFILSIGAALFAWLQFLVIPRLRKT